MMYRALYRKWRPQTFSDVVGQSHITVTLCNELKAGKLAHAYLFTGSRGTGKTSCAKILAKAVNCENPIDGNPCNECEVSIRVQFSTLSRLTLQVTMASIISATFVKKRTILPYVQSTEFIL